MTQPWLRQYPHLRLLFTGGEGAWLAQGLTEAERAKIFFDSMGVAGPQVLYEAASRTTYENAVLSATLAGVNPVQPWLLLTSAGHMPRAIATFGKAGWNVMPYPVDFHTGRQTPWTQYSLALGAKKWQLALHELVACWPTGWPGGPSRNTVHLPFGLSLSNPGSPSTSSVVGWAKRSVPTDEHVHRLIALTVVGYRAAAQYEVQPGGHAALCPPYGCPSVKGWRTRVKRRAPSPRKLERQVERDNFQYAAT